MDCETNTLIASWSEGAGADSYIATLEDSSGHSTTCQGTTEGSCNVTGLGCGQIYHVSVVSSDGYCDSPPTPVVDTPSGRTEGEGKAGCHGYVLHIFWFIVSVEKSLITV